MVSTKVFTSGNSQAVKIPEEFHISDSELFIKKIGATIVLYPKSHHWENLKKALMNLRMILCRMEEISLKLSKREIKCIC